MTYCQLGDIRMYYEITGEGEPVVLIHGLGSSSRDWEWQVAALSAYFKVITIDVRGHGRTDKPHQAYSVPMFALDLRRLLDRLEIEAVHLVGISMGGMIAFQTAVDAPDMVKSMVIVNSGPELIPRGVGQHIEVWRRLLIGRLLGMKKIGEVVGRRLFPEPNQATLRKLFTERWAENDKIAYLAATKALIGWSVQDSLGKIACPVLVLASDMDYTPVAAKEAYVTAMPNARLQVVSNSRHAMPIDQPKEFNTAIISFLQQSVATAN